MKNINRRSFLRTGITGAAGIVALSPAIVSAASAEQDEYIQNSWQNRYEGTGYKLRRNEGR